MPTDEKKLCSGFAAVLRDQAARYRKEAEEAWEIAIETRSMSDVNRACLAEGDAELCDLRAAVEEDDHQEWEQRMAEAMERHGMLREARVLREMAEHARAMGAELLAKMAQSGAEYIEEKVPPRKMGLSSGGIGPDMKGKPWL